MTVRPESIRWATNKNAKKILELFKENPDKDFTVFELQDEAKIKNVQTVRNYVNALLCRQLIRITNSYKSPLDPYVYKWSDELLEMDLVEDTISAKVYNELVDKAHKFRTGELGHEEALEWDRKGLEHVYQMLSADVANMKALLDNPDLWKSKTLVERLGFINEPGTTGD